MNTHEHEVVVLGAGVVGINTAYWLARAGLDVAVVERQPGPGLETSFANGGQVSVSHAEPWANPRAPFQVLRWLSKPDAPLLYRPKMDPYQWQWLIHWLKECIPYRTGRNIKQIVRLALFSRRKMIEVRRREQLCYDHKSAGILHFYRNQREFEHAASAAELMRQYGCNRQVVDRDQILKIEPALHAIAKNLVGGTYTVDDESGDAYLYTRGLARVCERMGVDFQYSTTVRRIDGIPSERRIRGLHLYDAVNGQRRFMRARHYVVALGAYSTLLLRKIGIRLMIYPAKGYSITLPVTNPLEAPNVSLTDDEYKLVYSRLGDRLRVAGTAELNGYNTALNMNRCRAIADNAGRIFPSAGDYKQASFWTGLRPATPTNVPYIGRSRYPNLWLNTGHGTLGWTMGCGSGKIVADQITGDLKDT